MMSKISASLVLALAISYVQADGHGYGHHGHHGHHYPHDRDADAAADYPDYGGGYAPPPADPPSGYGPPPADPPAPSYGPPAEDPATYAAPSDSYGAADEGKDIPDLTPLIIGFLFIVGLSLLFPWHVNIESAAIPNGRKRRDANEYYEIARTDYIGRSFEIYDHLNAALEPVDRACIEKITCQVGGLSYDVGLTSNPLLGLAAGFIPGTYGKYYKQFVFPENCEKIQCSAFP